MIDFDALWKILLVALAAGVGLTTVFGAGALALERLSGERGATVVRDGAIVAVAAIVCVAGVLSGLYAITHK